MKEVRVFYCNGTSVEFQVTKIDGKVVMEVGDALALATALLNVISLGKTEMPVGTLTTASTASTPLVAKSEFTPEQKEKIKAIKTKMKINSNEELNGYVHTWSLGNKNTWKDIKTSVDMEDFIKFMSKEVDGLQDDSKAPF